MELRFDFAVYFGNYPSIFIEVIPAFQLSHESHGLLESPGWHREDKEKGEFLEPSLASWNQEMCCFKSSQRN